MNSGAILSMSASSSESLNGSCGSGGGEVALKKGPWMAAEDKVLVEYVERYGEGNWNAVRKKTGLLRCGKSCRLRWTNHLRPNLKKGSFAPEEERLIIELHSRLGNKWARMAAQLPGRTDNEIKNFWNTRIKRRLRDGLPLYPHSQKPRQASPSQPPPQHSSVVKNELFIPQHQTAIPSFHGPFQSGFPGTEHVFYQTSTLLQDTSPLPIPSPRHKRCCDSSAFSISIMSTSSNDHPSVLSPHGIIPDSPLSFNLSSLQMEMGATPSPNSFSMLNPELPSSQLQFPRITNTAESCSGGSLFFDPGVLGDVTAEAHAWANILLNNFPNGYTQSEMNRPASNLVCPSGITLDTSPVTGINSSQEDQEKLSDFFLPNILTPTSEVNSRSPTISALGCAAGSQDSNDVRDNLGLDLHDIAALFPGASMAELGILPWENLTETY